MSKADPQIASSITPQLWSDNESEVDLLRFDYLASEIAGLVVTKHVLPITVGVFGDWGSGKSTLVRMVQKELNGKPNVLTLQFNGWLLEGYEGAKTSLMGSILDAIEDQAKEHQPLTEKGKGLLERLGKRVNWLQLAALAGRYVGPLVAGLPHLTAVNLGQDVINLFAGQKPPTLEEIQKLIEKAPDGPENIRRSIRDFRQDFSELLKEAKIETLVVFIDDLDRCLPDTIIETLEAIKLFLFVPGSAFVIGADERLIQYAVRQRFPELPGTETEVGRDYLEKLIQVPVRVPPLTNADIESYMNLLLIERRLEVAHYQGLCAQIAQVAVNDVSQLLFDLPRAQSLLPESILTSELQEDFNLTTQIVPVLAPGLNGNPRRTKRFLNTLFVRLSLGKRRGLILERRVLAKLMLLEYIRPEFFRTLATLQISEAGRPLALVEAEKILRTKANVPVLLPQDDADAKVTLVADDVLARRPQSTPTKSKEPATNTQKDQDKSSTALPEDSLPPEIQPWLADAWARNWLISEPTLSDVDLKPYFFIAHDKVGALFNDELRLTPLASEVLSKLLDSGKTSQELGLRRAAQLNNTDASAVFQHLATRIRQADMLDDRSPHGILISLMVERTELLPQLISLYGSLPETKITMGVPVALLRVTKDTPLEEATRGLISRWTRSPVASLARAATTILQRPSKGERK